jgi:hypothetical protein
VADPLLSTLAPAVATAFGGWFAGSRVERMRAWREEAARQENAAERSRIAIRLIEHELFRAEQDLADFARAGRHPARAQLTTTAWADHRETLSMRLGKADWDTMCAAYDAINGLNDLMRRRPATRTFESSDRLELRWRAIRRASWNLREELGEAEKLERTLDEDERLAAELWPQPEAAAG